MLNFYQCVLALRAEMLTATGDMSLTWLPALELGATPDQVIAYERPCADGCTFTCVVNFGAEAVPAPVGALLVASGDLASDGSVPQDTAAWFVR